MSLIAAAGPLAYETSIGGHQQVAWRFLGAAPSKFGHSATSVGCGSKRR